MLEAHTESKSEFYNNKILSTVERKDMSFFIQTTFINWRKETMWTFNEPLTRFCLPVVMHCLPVVERGSILTGGDLDLRADSCLSCNFFSLFVGLFNFKAALICNCFPTTTLITQ